MKRLYQEVIKHSREGGREADVNFFRKTRVGWCRRSKAAVKGVNQ
jgi:hypothetical protein